MFKMQSLYCTGIFFLCSSFLVEAISVDGSNLRSWDYTLISVSMTTDNAELAGGDTRVDRIGRGEYGLSGTLYANVDVPQDLEVDVTIYRSTDGGETYKLQPYSIPRQTVYSAVNNFYKKIIMPSVANCSNLPQFADTLEFMPAQVFKYEKCQVGTEGFPKYLADGWYKGVIETHGLVGLVWTCIVGVKQKSF
ncbi:uncharacterized protein LOC119548723 [Drosophila subpulchrella]|uniref:uncharacterized protein LOC119548723 n=1 Tax=Drosophila subpulchrella TaxID=1486046 RepID=UPI0018A183A7|nr:uncharacterized protein LOC119548723 [Drosophila subpulchrella]